MTNVVSASEAVALIRPVDSIGFGLGPANPDTFLAALGARVTISGPKASWCHSPPKVALLNTV